MPHNRTVTPSTHLRLSFAGVVGGVVFGSLALGPSLLPRAPLIAGLLVGVCAAIGYGVGTAVGWSVRRLRHQPQWRSGNPLRGVAGAVLAMVAVLGLGWGWHEQQQLAALMGVPGPGVTWPLVAVVVGVLVFAVLLLLARGIRALTRWLQRHAERVAPAPAATASAVSLMALLLVVGLGRTPALLATALSPLFQSMNAATTPGVVPPASAVVSGAAGSAVSWQSLGHDGRDFIAAVTSSDVLESFSGRPAQDPIRVYVGVDSSTDADERAQLAVRDLDTFGAWDREVVAVGTSTGTGTVDQGEVAPLEYLYNGDVATVSTQYSVLPSFLSFLVDGGNAQEAGRSLFEAVYARWREQPADDRPALVVFGESLGAYGGDAAFADLADLSRRTSGALFVGPPNGTALWQTLTDDRETGTPERLPIFGDGRVVRWADQPVDLQQPAAPWGPSRAAYLQNASDPVVWWAGDVLWARPDWLAEPRGPDVLPTLIWLPLFTFVGLTGDMINSQGVPMGHGHVYGSHQAAAWADIIPPPGWTEAETQRLTQALSGVG